jgi:archaellum biogenesis ATPase FlaH
MTPIKISVSSGLQYFEPLLLQSLEDLKAAITSLNWSPSLFRENLRRVSHFEETSLIALDVDEGLTLEEARQVFRDWRHVLAPSRNHQKEKNGLLADRFRILLFLSRPLTRAEDYYETWQSLFELFPFIDPACKDPSRFFYPSLFIDSVREHGRLVEVKEAPPPSLEVPFKRTEGGLESTEGLLSRATLDFLLNGAPRGSWHVSLFKAAMDWHEQALDEASFTEKAEKITGHLDEHDLHCIRDVFKRVPRYEPRGVGDDLEREARARDLIYRPKDFVELSLSFLKNKDQVYGLSTGIEGLDKLLGGGKRLGEITALTATAKAGKSSLTHFLIHNWLKKGISVGFASREMNVENEVTPNFLSMSFEENAWKAEMTEERVKSYTNEMLSWPIYYTKEYGYLEVEEFKAWVLALKKQGVLYFVLDHLLYAMANPEDFKEVSYFMREIKRFVNEEQIHLDVIIQPRNLQLGERIGAHSLRGGANISQAINTLLTLERVPEHRNVVKLSLEFGRSKLAQQGSIFLQYDFETTAFSEVEPELSTTQIGESREESGESFMDRKLRRL